MNHKKGHRTYNESGLQLRDKSPKRRVTAKLREVRREAVAATLDRVCAAVGVPKSIRDAQGGEFVSRDLDLRACRHGVILDVSQPGKPTGNAFMFRRGDGPPGPSLIAPHLQRPLPGRPHEPALVPEPCGRPRKAGGLAQMLQ